MPGDQALWWVFSDNGPSHTQSNGKPLGVEVQAMAYGYNRGTLIDNVVYYKYHIVNHSGNSYHNFRLAQWAEPDLGYYYDDYIGFDSSHRMEISYPGNNGCGTPGHPVDSLCFILNTAVTMISLPGDTGTAYVAAGSFDYYNNDASEIGNPTIDTEYNNYMRAKIRSGQHITDDFTGPCVPSKGYGSGSNTNYVFTGDPGDHISWSECTSCNNPGDRRYVLASNDFDLSAGSTADIVLALITTDPGAHGCPTANFDSIKVVADTAWAVYHNPLPPIPAAVNNIFAGSIDVYPNPVQDKLYIKNAYSTYSNPSVTIYNSLGQIMNVKAGTKSNITTIDISMLAPGMYYFSYSCGNAQKNEKFIKE